MTDPIKRLAKRILQEIGPQNSTIISGPASVLERLESLLSEAMDQVWNDSWKHNKAETIREARNAALEEAAKVAQFWSTDKEVHRATPWACGQIANDIRALRSGGEREWTHQDTNDSIKDQP